MKDVKYEYKLVEFKSVNAYFSQGWEPAPNTNHVETRLVIKVFLRRRI